MANENSCSCKCDCHISGKKHETVCCKNMGAIWNGNKFVRLIDPLGPKTVLRDIDAELKALELAEKARERRRRRSAAYISPRRRLMR